MKEPFMFSSLGILTKTGSIININGNGVLDFADGFCYIHKLYKEPGTKHDFLIPVDLIVTIEFDRTVD